MNILSIENIYKNYGSIQALDNVSFNVPEGSVFGILGPNGSGKTTLLSIAMSILRPSSGYYKLFEETPTDNHRKKIGTLLETPNFYHYLSAVKNLEISAAIKDVDNSDIKRVLEIVDLSKRQDSKFSTYSLGMKQRLAIAAALLGNPDVLVLDEPTNGLDPVGISEIRALIKKLSLQGKTIIMASHLLDEVEKVCTHVAILKQGKLMAAGSVNEIFSGNTKSANKTLAHIGSSKIEELKNVIKNMSGYLRHEIDGDSILLHFDANLITVEGINSFCFSNNIVLNMLQLKKQSLENKFIELTQA